MANHTITGSGDGTRPTTSGGVDNIGGGERFSQQRNAAGEEVSGPAPKERMQDKRKDVEATRHDDSDAFNLHEDLTPESNQDPARPRASSQGPSQAPSQTPAQKAMKQFSKTPAERGEPAAAPGPAGASRPPPTPGDAPVGEAGNEGSSPYGDRSREEVAQRER